VNTMIPNEVRFNQSLNDLPARATQVSSEALGLSGSGACEVYTKSDGEYLIRKDRQDPLFVAPICRRICTEFGRIYEEGQYSTTPYGRTSLYRVKCSCC
jgi:hypothetical protein